MKYYSLLFALLSSLICTGQQKLIPTENLALLNVKVANMEMNPRPNDHIIFEGINSKKKFTGQSDESGNFQILLPEGDNYKIKIQGLSKQIDFDKVNIPEQEGTITGDLVIKYRPERSFTLHDVHFETGKSTLLPASYPTLNELVEAIKIKKDLRLEIAGHTDSIGDDESNQILSQNRAQAVVNYLINKGINKSKLTAKGYGEKQPIATNETKEGRKENRRTEARIL
ncbi:MAG: OmpA family protein [Saprospiraceae bacterium]|nr:OmpA family protein [Saprospiraceae bacterium]